MNGRVNPDTNGTTAGPIKTVTCDGIPAAATASARLSVSANGSARRRKRMTTIRPAAIRTARYAAPDSHTRRPKTGQPLHAPVVSRSTAVSRPDPTCAAYPPGNTDARGSGRATYHPGTIRAASGMTMTAPIASFRTRERASALDLDIRTTATSARAVRMLAFSAYTDNAMNNWCAICGSPNRAFMGASSCFATPSPTARADPGLRHSAGFPTDPPAMTPRLRPTRQKTSVRCA